MGITEYHTVTIYKGTGFFSSTEVGTVQIERYYEPYAYRSDRYSAQIKQKSGFSSHTIGEIRPFYIDVDDSDYVGYKEVCIPTGRILFQTREVAGFASSSGNIQAGNSLIGNCNPYDKTIRTIYPEKTIGKYVYSKTKWNSDDLSEDLITLFASAGALLLLSIELKA
jgi:hypothetical protein